MTEEIEDKAYDLEDRLIDTLFFLKRQSEAIPSFDIRHSTFFGSVVRFSLVLWFAFPWFCGSLFLFSDCRQGNLQPLYPGTRNTQPLNPACGGVAPCAKTQTLEPLIAKES